MSDATEKDGAQIVILPPVLFAIQLVLAEVVNWVWPLGFGSSSEMRLAFGLGTIAVGGGLVLRAMTLFKSLGQDPNPRTATPSVTRAGPYGFTRNPMYLAGALFLLGIGCARGNAWIIVSMIPGFFIMHYGVIVREEAYLEDKFGEEYLAYKRTVRRWL